MNRLLVAVTTCLAACSSGGTAPLKEEPAPMSPMSTPDTAPEPDTTATKVEGPAPTWSIWDGELQILTVYGRPGPLISTAPPPPGPAKWQMHPFLSATASSPLHEDRLRRLLRASTSLEGYLQALRDAGFRVQEEAPTP